MAKDKERKEEKRAIEPRRSDEPGPGPQDTDQLFDGRWREFENRFGEPFPGFWGGPWRRMLPWLAGGFMRPGMMPWRLPGLSSVREPLADVEDKGTEFVVVAELPGIPKGDVEVNVSNASVEIRAAVKQETEESEKGYYRKERAFREVYRQLPLPAEVLPNRAEARMEDGLLRIRIPKKEPTPAPRTRKVKIE